MRAALPQPWRWTLLRTWPVTHALWNVAGAVVQCPLRESFVRRLQVFLHPASTKSLLPQEPTLLTNAGGPLEHMRAHHTFVPQGRRSDKSASNEPAKSAPAQRGWQR